MDDLELLQRYCRDGSQAAFTELVGRHVDLVYSAARRQVGPSLAQDVSQQVFLELARQAGRLRPGSNLATWLYVVTRRKAVDALRRESRRRHQEEAAQEIAAMTSPPPPDWDRLAPRLDEAMASLSDDDRRALIMRFFENRRIREIGIAFNASEDAAQKRVARALDRLREALLSRGVTAAVSSAALGAEISAHAVESAPAGLASVVSAGAVKGSAAIASGSWSMVGWGGLAAAIAFGVYQGYAVHAASLQVTRLETRLVHEQIDLARLQSAARAAKRSTAEDLASGLPVGAKASAMADEFDQTQYSFGTQADSSSDLSEDGDALADALVPPKVRTPYFPPGTNPGDVENAKRYFSHAFDAPP